jgi:hypothetical protein
MGQLCLVTPGDAYECVALRPAIAETTRSLRTLRCMCGLGWARGAVMLGCISGYVGRSGLCILAALEEGAVFVLAVAAIFVVGINCDVVFVRVCSRTQMPPARGMTACC